MLIMRQDLDQIVKLGRIQLCVFHAMLKSTCGTYLLALIKEQTLNIILYFVHIDNEGVVLILSILEIQLMEATN